MISFKLLYCPKELCSQRKKIRIIIRFFNMISRVAYNKIINALR
jgi:hypothetical protein